MLQRANRWGAILLIDEADVYIRERAADMEQNAIVGVFLRLLEYYEGVLFLTTNIDHVVDDAIRSRCIAHIRYSHPDAAERKALWRIYAEQFSVVLDTTLTAKLVKVMQPLSGRSIRRLCRMAASIAVVSGKPTTFEMFEWIAQHQDLEYLVEVGKPAPYQLHPKINPDGRRRLRS